MGSRGSEMRARLRQISHGTAIYHTDGLESVDLSVVLLWRDNSIARSSPVSLVGSELVFRIMCSGPRSSGVHRTAGELEFSRIGHNFEAN